VSAKFKTLSTTTSSAALTGTVGLPFTHTLTASGGVERWEVAGLPPGLALNENTGVISGLPADSGTFDLSVIAFNASGGSSPFPLQVVIAAPVGSPVVTSPATAQGQVGVPFTLTLAATGTPETFNAVNPPGFLTFDPITGALAGTPDRPGRYELITRASNALGAGARRTLTLTVAAAAGTPAITSLATFELTAGSPVSFTLTATEAPTLFSSTALPAGLGLDHATGVFTGTPSEPGVYTVEVWALNALGEGNRAPLTITVLAAPGTPTLTAPVTIPARLGQAFSAQLLASNAPDSFNAPLLPGWATFDPYTGVLGGTPDATGTFPLVFSANNASGTGAPFTVTINVTSASAFELWAAGFFSGPDLLDPAKVGPTADPDADGLPNLLEYALGLSPAAATPGGATGMPVISTLPAPDAVLRLTYRRAREDVAYEVQTTTTLGNPASWTATGVTQGTPNGDGTTTATVPINTGPRFLRLQVTLLP
jgi:hypothetical protein